MTILPAARSIVGHDFESEVDLVGFEGLGAGRGFRQGAHGQLVDLAGAPAFLEGYEINDVGAPVGGAIGAGANRVAAVIVEGHVLHAEIELALVHRGHRCVIFSAVDGLPFDDVARPEQAHEIAQMLDFLVGVVDRHRGDAEHLVAAGTPHRIDAAEAAAMAHRELRRVGARAQIFG